MRKDRPSRTAYKVALCIVTLGERSEMEEVLPPGIVDATARLLLASGVVGPTAIRFSRSRRAVSIYEAFDWILPGQFEAFGYRKAFCERQVREGIGAGASQILVLGAGYDTLSWRLAPEFPEVDFFEIDHPATARLKAKGIDAMEGRDNLILISEDLSKRRLDSVLGEHPSWNCDAATVIIAEGLVMYLPPDAVRGMFCQCAELAGAGSRIAFSYIPAGSDGRLDLGRWTGLMLWLQKLAGEPLLWSVKPEDLGSFLRETGWNASEDLPGSTERRGVEYFISAVKKASSDEPRGESKK